MEQVEDRSRRRQAAAAAALLLAAASLVLAVAVAVESFPRGLSVIACLLGAVAAAWFGIRRRGAWRVAGLGIAAVLLIGAVVLVIVEGRPVADALIVAGFAGASRPRAPRSGSTPRCRRRRRRAGRCCSTTRSPAAARRSASTSPTRRARAASRPSSCARRRPRDARPPGGRRRRRRARDGRRRRLAGRGRLGRRRARAALRLHPGGHPQPLRARPRRRPRRRRRRARRASSPAASGVVDLAEINGRVFVNNVSLGLYAEAVEREGYREAKIRTLLDTVPEVLGPGAEPLDLHWAEPGDGGSTRGVAILVSNNRYRLGTGDRLRHAAAPRRRASSASRSCAAGAGAACAAGRRAGFEVARPAAGAGRHRRRDGAARAAAAVPHPPRRAAGADRAAATPARRRRRSSRTARWGVVRALARIAAGRL